MSHIRTQRPSPPQPSDRWARPRGLAPALLAVLVSLLVTAPTVAPASAGVRTSAPAPSTEPATVPGSIGLRLVDAPTSAGDDPRARVYVVDHLRPGTVIERRIEVSNTTSSTAAVRLYPSAATIDDGSFVGAAGDTANELSSWTSTDPDEISVDAGDSVISTVTIAVPDDASPGEQYGVVWAEVSSDPDAGGVTQVSRVGIRLYVSVGPGGAPAADFTVDSLTAARDDDGHPLVLATVENTGGRALDMTGELELVDGPGGLSAGPFPAQLGRTLAVGDTHDVSVTLDDQLPAGPWEATVTLRSGLVERTATATITFPDAGSAEPVDTGPSLPSWVLPAAGVLLVALLLALGVLVARHRARRRARRDRPRGHRAGGGPGHGVARRERTAAPPGGSQPSSNRSSTRAPASGSLRS